MNDREFIHHDSGCYPTSVFGMEAGQFTGMDNRGMIQEKRTISFAGKEDSRTTISGTLYCRVYRENGDLCGIFSCKALYVPSIVA